jgi:hypothetical protein
MIEDLTEAMVAWSFPPAVVVLTEVLFAVPDVTPGLKQPMV